MQPTLTETENLDPYDVLVHVGPATLAGRYLRLFWQPVYRAKDLLPGRAIPIRILGEQFTLYRGERPLPNPLPGGEGTVLPPLPLGEGGGEGVPHVVAFRCAHRGTQLSVGRVEGDCIRCRYHGWMYDGSGQCVEQPGEDPTFVQRVRIRAYPTQEYAGLIFAHLGEGDPPPFRRYPLLDEPGVLIADPPEAVPCSFWNRFDNDVFHLVWTHRSTALRSGRLEYLIPRSETFEETDYGYLCLRQRPGRPPDHHRFFMPNTTQWRAKTKARGYQDQELFETKFTWSVPIDDANYVGFDVTLTPLTGEAAAAYAQEREDEQEPQADLRWEIARAILAGKMTIEQIPDEISFYNMNAIDDYVTQVGQGAIANRGAEHPGRIDARVIFHRRLWLRELHALDDGRPLKDWQVPDQLLSEEVVDD